MPWIQPDPWDRARIYIPDVNSPSVRRDYRRRGNTYTYRRQYRQRTYIPIPISNNNPIPGSTLPRALASVMSQLDPARALTLDNAIRVNANTPINVPTNKVFVWFSIRQNLVGVNGYYIKIVPAGMAWTTTLDGWYLMLDTDQQPNLQRITLIDQQGAGWLTFNVPGTQTNEVFMNEQILSIPFIQ